MTRNWRNKILKYFLINCFLYYLSISQISSLNINELIAEFDLDDLFPGLELKSLIPGGDTNTHLFEEDLKGHLPGGLNFSNLMPGINIDDLLSGNTFDIFKNWPVIMKLLNEINKLNDWQEKIMVKADNYYRSKHPTHDRLLKCVADLKGIKRSFPELWVLPLLDASFKPPTGILMGSVHWPGSFDQCRRFKTPKINKLGLKFKGQYCDISLYLQKAKLSELKQFPLFRLGVCAPDSCGNDELNALLSFTNDIPMAQNITVNCAPEKYSYDFGAIIVVSVLGIAFCFISFATVYDCFLTRKFGKTEQGASFEIKKYPAIESEKSKVLCLDETREHVEYSEKIKKIGTWRKNVDWKMNVMTLMKSFYFAVQHFNIRNFPWHCFSAIRNLESIFDTSSCKEELECIRGLRVLSMFSIMLGHTFLCSFAVSHNLVENLQEIKTKRWQLVVNSFYAVDTFYTLSGFLLAYLTFKKLPNLNFKWVGYMILHRYWRLVPVYFVIVLLHINVYDLIGNGPYWDLLPSTREMCAKYWWRNLLFVNNLFPLDEACISIAWYLANDMQFFVISPVLFYVLSRRKMKYISGVSVMILFSFLVVFIRGYITYYSISWNTVESQMDYFIISQTSKEGYLLYVRPYSRIGPYIVGYLVGYLQFRWQESIKISQGLVNFTWATAAITMYFMYIHLYTYPLGKPLLILFLSSSRSLWALIICWVIFASLNGYGGIVNRILSAKIWIPFSRLTYCAYFVHIMYIQYYFFSRKTPYHVEYLTTLLLFVGIVAFTYGLSLLLCLLIEAPLLKLEKHLMKKE